MKRQDNNYLFQRQIFVLFLKNPDSKSMVVSILFMLSSIFQSKYNEILIIVENFYKRFITNEIAIKLNIKVDWHYSVNHMVWFHE
jgi:hypothetical protein